ncbi:hypothetical protein SDRG_05081 [Saprolegnia diclina VS20]|uniref:Uncharacterized protein n=1 Tax=Saprolegnia diclina (strain VS20) TaxID=1156394 RepID=T0RY77_SAPDV|nr:hypothetical protein SDRG_05081 [Saprolegnia diclina VS20]EQC37478.1 hypothetical protein SDRG_05081 [Saprolegnia diclina VS20]|eukprot:XP_008608998.1 hypothetical protein SDRG_05081 [Saprolegnia diclina VS20]
MLAHDADVPSEELKRLVRKSEADRKTRSASKEIVEMTNYILFLTLFLIATLQGWNNSSYKSRAILMSELRDKPFLRSQTTVRKAFKDVACIDELHEFLVGPFYAALYLGQSYDADVSFPTGPLYAGRGFIAGVERVVGSVRIGQLRVDGAKCQGTLVHELQHGDYDPMCYPEYSSTAESIASFGYNATYNALPMVPSEPTYVSRTGRYYPSPRFAVFLPSVENDSSCDPSAYTTTCDVYKQIDALRTSKFFDKATRVVLIDFTLYNANTDQQSVVRLVAEHTMSGGLATQADCMTYRLYRNQVASDHVRLTLELLVLLQVFFQLYAELRLCQRLGRAYWHMTANVAHALSLLLFIACAVLRVLCYLELPAITMSSMGPTSFPNFRPSANYYMMADVATSFTCFLSWLKLFKFLGFLPMFAPLTKTVTKAARKVSSLIVIFFIALLGSALSFHMAFGADLERYYSFWASFIGLLSILQGELDLLELQKSNRILGPIFFVVFVTLMFFVILNMFIVVISDAFAEAKSELHLLNELNVDTLSKEVYHHVLHNIVFRIPLLGKILRRVYDRTVSRLDKRKHATKSLNECSKQHVLFQSTHATSLKLLKSTLASKKSPPARFQVVLDEYRKHQMAVASSWTTTSAGITAELALLPRTSS